MIYDFGIIGGGIIGLSTAWALGKRYPGSSILLVEKENRWGFHQTGHNSGVIHSGIYYKPGSLKAQLARQGNLLLVDFCREQHIPFEICGKLIVASSAADMAGLEILLQRAHANGIQAEKLSSPQAKEIEPHLVCEGALRVFSTGIVDFKKVCERLAEGVGKSGGDLRLNTRTLSIRTANDGHRLETTSGDFSCRFLVNCAGLHSDRVARWQGLAKDIQIIPFRGEYYELRPEKRRLVNHLIYPIPQPELPFLGVHFTRMMDGSVHAGPNAVLSFKREGYRKWDFSLVDALESLRFKGFWKLAKTFAKVGVEELWRSLSKEAFVRDLQKMVPEVRSSDLVPAEAGVRAQCVNAQGELVDDFYIEEGFRALHICNAPSPAATASLAIANHVAGKIAL
jgi:(S)-2-hydroxyglutarate dehydrogenase